MYGIIGFVASAIALAVCVYWAIRNLRDLVTPPVATSFAGSGLVGSVVCGICSVAFMMLAMRVDNRVLTIGDVDGVHVLETHSMAYDSRFAPIVYTCAITNTNGKDRMLEAYVVAKMRGEVTLGSISLNTGDRVTLEGRCPSIRIFDARTGIRRGVIVSKIL